MSEAPPDLSLAGLQKAFQRGGRPVLDGLDLTLPAGEITALLGPSGAGKTTLARLVAGLDQPDAGTIRLGEAVLNDPAPRVSPRDRRVGMVFQGLALWSHRTVAGHLNAVLAGRRVPRAQRAAQRREVLAVAGLGSADDSEARFERRYPHQLSGGEQQRLAIARALAGDPAVLILDEPLTGFEESVREPVRAEWRRLAARGLTILLITHDRREALALGSRVAVLDAGRVVQCGPPPELLDRPRSAFVARFVGDCNLLPWNSPLGPFRLAAGCEAATGPVAVRPLAVRVSAADGVPARLERMDTAVDGARLHLRLAADDTVLVAAWPHAVPPPAEPRVSVVGEVWRVAE
ncbi:MAG: ABC transporter ATP-binding protein [Planctomycetota bacterium]